MKKFIQLFLTITIFALAMFILPNTSYASEGTYEIRSTTNESYRCWASSLFMPNDRYKVSIGCVDLIYPPQPPQLYEFYVLWTTPIEKGNPVRLGVLGSGKNNFDVQKPFSELFVSLEEKSGPKTPSNQIVMRGRVQPINFLLRPTTPTLTPTITQVKDEVGNTDVVETNTTQMTTKDKIFLALRRAGIAALVALVVIIGLVFVVSRSRG